MSARSTYFTSTAFFAIGCAVFSTCAAVALYREKLNAFMGLGLLSVGFAWLTWVFGKAFGEVGRKFVISDGVISSVASSNPNSVALSDVKKVISDANEGYVHLLGSDDQELLRIHIDNPIVPELKAYCDTQKKS